MIKRLLPMTKTKICEGRKYKHYLISNLMVTNI